MIYRPIRSPLTPALTRASASYGSAYSRLRNAAIAAARRNNAALWFAGAPSDLAGFVYQDSAATTPATGTDPIGYLRDRANNLYPALQATAANKPTLELQANGYYGMRFDGADDMLTAPQTPPAAGTRIIAYSQTDLQFRAPVGSSDGVANTNCMKFRNNGGVWFRSGTGTDIQVAGVYAAGVPGVISHTWNASTQIAYKNGAQIGTAGMPASWVGGVGVLTLGHANASGDGRALGLFWMWLEAPSILPAADRIAIERFAALLSGATYS